MLVIIIVLILVFLLNFIAVLFDRGGELVKTVEGGFSEGSTGLGGGGGMSTIHVENFFNAIHVRI
ncbi:MAG: hypothetical protein ACFFC3_16475, partial [Candidatus Odinarchaeota archaeon]